MIIDKSAERLFFSLSLGGKIKWEASDYGVPHNLFGFIAALCLCECVVFLSLHQTSTQLEVAISLDDGYDKILHCLKACCSDSCREGSLQYFVCKKWFCVVSNKESSKRKKAHIRAGTVGDRNSWTLHATAKLIMALSTLCAEFLQMTSKACTPKLQMRFIAFVVHTFCACFFTASRINKLLSQTVCDSVLSYCTSQWSLLSRFFFFLRCRFVMRHAECLWGETWVLKIVF